MSFRRWDVISVPFPFVEGHATKRRPALVVSTDAFHRAHRACFGAMITTARHMQDVRADDIEIADLGATGLPRPCVIRLARLATFEWGAQIRRVGTLHRHERQAIETLLQRWFGMIRRDRAPAPPAPSGLGQDAVDAGGRAIASSTAREWPREGFRTRPDCSATEAHCWWPSLEMAV